MIEERTLASLLADLRQRDIKLWLDGDRLRVNAPAGTLTAALQAEIVRQKPAILTTLRQAEAGKVRHEPELTRARRDAPLPLSSSQQRLWFLDQFEPGNAAYNIPAVLRVRGPLDVPALHRSLDEIVRRHEALRTHFETVAGRGTQVVEASVSLELQRLAVTHLAPNERQAAALALAREVAEQPFDLRVAPMLRCALIRLAGEEHLLVLVLHHIAADAWSLGIVGSELAALYPAFAANRPSSLPELSLQYADFTAWQQQRLGGERLQEQLSFWTETLAGAPQILELPTDRPRPTRRSWRGGRQCLTLETALVDEVKEFGRAEGATPFMVLLAAFETLLHRLSRQEDIVVGTPVAGRGHVDTENMVGFFVNNLVLRTDLSGEPTFRELVARVRRVSLDAFANQDVPFEKLVEVVQPERDASRLPLFQVLFSLQNVPLEEPRLGALDVELVRDQVADTARYDLTFELYERPHGLEVWVEYSTDLFEPETIGRMTRQYELLLRNGLTAPETRITELPLLSSDDVKQVLVEWNATAADYPRDMGVHQLFERQAASTPDAVAVVVGDQQLTYAELNARANKLARHLVALGVRPETLVGIHLERSLEMVVALLAILKSGAAYLPLDPTFPADRLRYMLEDSGAALLITQSHLAESLGSASAVPVLLDAVWPKVEALPSTDLQQACDGDRLAYVLYTSGSTGRPKGVQVEHHSLVNFLTAMQARPGLQASDTLLSVTTLSFDIAGLELFLPLISGARIVLVSGAVAVDGSQLLAVLERSGTTIMQATPATWRLLLAAGWRQTPGLRVLCGGEAMSRELAAQLLERAAEVWNLYGPTETTIWSTCHQVTSTTTTSVSIGKPIANTQAYVLDARRALVPVGVPGELYLAGDGVARGYLNQPELTAARFVTDPFAARPDARMYRTGDVVRWRADGTLEYLERADTQVKVRGYRIELGEIESLLEQQPSVAQARVIVREDVPGDKRLAGYVVAEGNGSVRVAELRAALRERLPTYMVPSTLTLLEALPLTPNGKVDRKRLPAPADAPSLVGRQVVAPRNGAQQEIASIWQKLLGMTEVGINDNFFDLGGHSLSILQVHASIRSRFDTDLSVAEMFQYPTIEALAARVQRAHLPAAPRVRRPAPHERFSRA